MNDDFLIEDDRLLTYSGKDLHVVVPNVRIMGESAFRYNFDVQSIIIPESVEEIGDRCFEACHKLKDIVLPRSLRKLV